MKKAVLTTLFLSAVLTLCPTSTMPQQPAAFQYAVKFVCGKSPGEVVAPGVYFTAINVHNPTNRVIGFKKKFVIAPPLEKPGPPPRVSSVAEFGPDIALEIDCQDILRHLVVGEEPTPTFLKGFVVIVSGVQLDVVAVYTAAGSTGQVETLYIERVPPRVVNRLP